MRQNIKHLKPILAVMLTFAALAMGQTAMAKTVTYIFSGQQTDQTKYTGYFYTEGAQSTHYNSSPSPWIYNSTSSISFSLPDGITLTLSSPASRIQVTNGISLFAQGEATLTVNGVSDNYSNYIYHVRLLDNSGNVIQLDANGMPVVSGGVSQCDYWNMTTNFSQTYIHSIGFDKIEISYGSNIPITDATLSGIDDSYIVSDAAIKPEPTVTWHDNTLTKGTHYTLSYQNNTSAGTATVKANGTGAFYPNTYVSANYTLVWATYTVRFIKNNNSASGTMDDQAFTYGTAQNLTPNAFTAPVGFHFNKWTTNANSTGYSYSDGQSVSNLTNVDGATVNLYAHWMVNEYTVTLDKQGGEGGDNSVTVKYHADMPAIIVPTRDDYEFGGYWTGENGTGTKYYNADGTSAHTWDLTTETTLYAKWTQVRFVVTFDKQAGTGGTDNVKATINQDMPAITVPTREDYVFDGYFTEINGGGTKYYNADGTSAHTWDLTTETTLYANWSVEMTGGGTENNPYIITYRSQLLRFAERTANGQSFNGYFIKLAADIDMKGVNWGGIGTFKGTFDGDGHTISNVTISKPEEDGGVGLFSAITSIATVKNLILDGASITGSTMVGGLVGRGKGASINNCIVKNVCVTATRNDPQSGIIVAQGFDSEPYTHNYYVNCSLTKDGETYTSGIAASGNNVDSRDLTGAKGAYELTFEAGATVNRTGGTAIGSSANRVYDDGATVAGRQYYISGATITLSHGNTPPAGYEAPFSGYYATDGNGNDITSTVISESTLTMPASDVSVIAGWSPKSSLVLTLNAATVLGEGKFVTSFYHGSADYQLPEGALAYTAGLDGTQIVFYRIGEASDIIPHGTAVIIIADADNVTLTKLNSNSGITPHAGNILQGSDTDIATPAGDVYVLGASGEPVVLGFYKYTGATIPAGKAYYVAQ